MFSKLEYIISKIIKKMHLRAIKNSDVDKTSSIAAGTQFVDSKMGRHSFCGYDCIITNTNIGSFCSISGNCEIGGASHSIEWVSTSPVFNENRDQIKKKYSYHQYNTSKHTEIGNDVWIGSKVLIKSGVSIGNGAVVGMGSVVTKDIPPYEIWAGNPAKLIRKRFNEDTINKLLETKWWDFNDEKLCKYAQYFDDVAKFIEEVN
ncbi:CatB-related O-acetyltransferase [Candidatus Clostridium stratigraminis]|uniref:CatB-related O-acetyltransferase n=1 Tax=Candidatus Clostridium stratigraminis TaxID=3381661 RepID=A0ABW8T8E6_9CLOT